MAALHRAVVEGGQNSNRRHERNHEALAWLADGGRRSARGSSRASVGSPTRPLARTRGDLPHALHVHHRHGITAADHFRMGPGSRTPAHASQQLLARTGAGEIRARGGGLRAPCRSIRRWADDGSFSGAMWGGEGEVGGEKRRSNRLDRPPPTRSGTHPSTSKCSIIDGERMRETVALSPITTSLRRARVSATFMRSTSARKPISASGFERTSEITTALLLGP